MCILFNNINNRNNMNSYYNFLSKIQKNLKTVRVLDTHVSYDLLFSNKWVLPRNMGKGVEVVKNGIDGDKISLSFVCPINKTSVDQVENLIDNIIISLFRERLFFDYATDFRFEHDTIPENFVFSDEEYKHFEHYLLDLSLIHI